MLGNSEGKVETMAAVHLYAAGGFVTLAGSFSFSSKLQRLLWTGFLRRSFLSGIDGVVAAPLDTAGNRYRAGSLLFALGLACFRFTNHKVSID